MLSRARGIAVACNVKSLLIFCAISWRGSTAFTFTTPPPRSPTSRRAEPIATAKELGQIAFQSKARTVGSLRYNKSWKHWSQLSIFSIRHYLSQHLPVQVNVKEYSKLRFALGDAADKGEMPSFACAGSRSGYALGNFCRARLLADLLFHSNLLHSFNDKNTVRLISLGGGPGYDFVGAALVGTFVGAPNVEAIIFDYEEEWQDVVKGMATAAAVADEDTKHTCQWGGKCDITKPLSHPSNAALSLPRCTLLRTTDLFVCQYCIAENAVSLRASKLAFFADLFHQAKTGTVFLFTETTPRVWPDFVDLVSQTPELRATMDIKFPRHLGRGKSGPQLLLQKVADTKQEGSLLLSPDQQFLCEGFRHKRVLHERKMESGWGRQRRKVRGAKATAD